MCILQYEKKLFKQRDWQGLTQRHMESPSLRNSEMIRLGATGLERGKGGGGEGTGWTGGACRTDKALLGLYTSPGSAQKSYLLDLTGQLKKARSSHLFC